MLGWEIKQAEEAEVYLLVHLVITSACNKILLLEGLGQCTWIKRTLIIVIMIIKFLCKWGGPCSSCISACASED